MSAPLRSARVLAVCMTAGLLGGCFSLQDKPAAAPAAPQAAAAQKARQTRQKNTPSFSMPSSLGGILSSDNWTVYKDKEEEEFEGQVSYDSDAYVFRADYVLSQRKKNTLTARGQVYLRKNEPDGAWYELRAQRVTYNYQTGQGRADAAAGQFVQLVYTYATGEKLTARARQADIHTQDQTYRLRGQAVLTRTDALGQTVTLRADQISVRQAEQYALLEGHAEVQNAQYRLQADTLEYNGAAQSATAQGGRVLAQGTAEGNTFAIIADTVSADTQHHTVRLQGGVQGWVVSDQINQSAANKSL